MSQSPNKRTRFLMPSQYKSMELTRMKQETQEDRAAEQVRKTRTKNFNVYGDERTKQEIVSCLSRSVPNKELNVK